jgi:hypothetical protein
LYANSDSLIFLKRREKTAESKNVFLHRPAEREPKVMEGEKSQSVHLERQLEELRNAPEGTVCNFVLYVDEGEASARALALLKEAPMRSDTHVQNVRALSRIPEWMTGAPVLADKFRGVAYRGTEALKRLTDGEGCFAPKNRSKKKRSTFVMEDA